MKQPESRQLGAVGEAAVKLAFLRLGWGVADAPREHDVGTDLYLLVRDDRLFDVGLVMGAQVKAGASWFDEPGRGEDGDVVGWWFRADRAHGNYWLTHTLPHLLILHDDDSGESYWVGLTIDSVRSTGKGIKVFVPRSNTVCYEQREALFAVAYRDAKAEIRSSRREANRQADYAFVSAIDLMSTYSGKSPQDANMLDFRLAFAAELRALHGLTGGPDIATLSRKAGFDPMKVQEYLSGKYLPSRKRTVALVQAMAEYAQERGIDIASHQVCERTWARKWRIAKKNGMQKILKSKVMSRIT